MIIRSPYSCVYDNLAYEELLFSHYSGDGIHLLLYVNSPCIVIGRFQNPWREARLDCLAAQAVSLARRVSGGGTVFHDPGNLNFSVFSPRAVFDRRTVMETVVACLAAVGVTVALNDRMDLLAGNRKVSGSAYRLLKDKAMHHGTLLVDADLSRLSGLIGPSYPGIEGKGVVSVPSPVANLGYVFPGITVETVSAALCSAEYFCADAVIPVLPVDGDVRRRAAVLGSPEWVFGKTPAFSVFRDGNVYSFPPGQRPCADGWSLPFDRKM